MKNRSFLFLIAALAMGLALFGCSTDSDSSTDTVYQGWAGDVEDIAAAFDKVDDVYLTRGITVTGTETLDIKVGKRLHLNGNSITLQTGSSVILSAANSIIWSGEERAVVSGKIVVDAGATVYLIGPSAAFPEDNITVPVGATVVPIESSAEKLTYAESGGRAFTATNNPTLLFGNNGAWLGGSGGTKTIYIGNLGVPDNPAWSYVIGGSVSVAGNVTLKGPITGNNSELEVLGNLTSEIVPKGTTPLVTSKLTARSINTKGGIFDAAVDISSPSLKSLFDGASTFTGALTALGPVQFTNDVTFTEASTIDGGATFTGGKKVTGKVSVTGPVTVSGTDGIILAADGAIAYANGVSTTFLTGAGTLAALGGSISVKPGATELLIQDVSGKGTFSAGNKPITLSGSSQIKVEGTTSVYFDGVGSIASANYSIGNAAGTLSTDKTYILTADGIIGSNGIKATLKHIGEDNADGKIIIAVSDSKVLTITDVNIDLNSTTGGSISLGSGSAGIILNGAGSITTGASGVHTLAWGGTIYTDYADSGSLAAGSIAGYSAGGSITAAGSIGTTSGNFITQNGSFAILDMGITADVIQTALQKASTTPTAAVSQANGSIAVFQLSN